MKLNKVSSFLWHKHLESKQHKYALRYRNETLYCLAAPVFAGFSSQIIKHGIIATGRDYMNGMESFQFLTAEILSEYFPGVEECEYFIAHLTVEDQKREICQRIFFTEPQESV